MRLAAVEVLYLIVSIAVVIACILRLFFDYRVVMYVLIVMYFWLFALTLKGRSFSIYQVFLITYFVFLLGRVFLNCLGLYDVRTLAMLQHSMMPDDIALLTLEILLVFMIGTSYAWMVSKARPRYNYFSKKPRQFILGRVIKTLYYVYIVLFILKLLYLVSAIRRFGYLALFNGTISENIKYPLIFTGVASITEMLFIFILFHERDTKSFWKYAGPLLLAGFIKMLTGQRGYGLVLLLYIIYLRSTYYKEVKITNIRMILIALSIPIVIQVIWNFRYGRTIDVLDILQNNIYVHTLESQGSSIEVIAGTIMHADRFQNKIPFILGYFVDFVRGRTFTQNMEAITEGNYLGYQLTYAINSAAFLSGRGTGTSYVAEAYSTFSGSLFLLLIGAYLSARVVLVIANRAYKNMLLYGLSFYLLTDFIYSPRDSIFKSLDSVAIVILATLLYQFVLGMRRLALHSYFEKEVGN